MQKIHKADGAWDTLVKRSLVDEWGEWLEMLKEMKVLEIPRFYFYGVKFSKEDQVELHGFSDASGAAYGAVVYVVDVRTPNPTIVTSKSIRLLH